MSWSAWGTPARHAVERAYDVSALYEINTGEPPLFKIRPLCLQRLPDPLFGPGTPAEGFEALQLPGQSLHWRGRTPGPRRLVDEGKVCVERGVMARRKTTLTRENDVTTRRKRVSRPRGLPHRLRHVLSWGTGKGAIETTSLAAALLRDYRPPCRATVARLSTPARFAPARK